MSTEEPGTDVARWADEAMYRAAPIKDFEPKVTLVSMTANPLKVMAAANEQYRQAETKDG